MNNVLLKVDSVSRHYHIGDSDVHALQNVSVVIRQAEFVSVTGPSGSGKSTFMNLCGCLDSPSSGRLEIDGVDTASMSDDELAELRNRKLGFVFQQFNLLAAMRQALENHQPRPAPDIDRVAELLGPVTAGARAACSPELSSAGATPRRVRGNRRRRGAS